MKAFPQLAHWDIDERNGMDLRDYFAAKAMQGLIEDGHDCKWLTHRAYEFADAMMEARKK